MNDTEAKVAEAQLQVEESNATGMIDRVLAETLRQMAAKTDSLSVSTCNVKRIDDFLASVAIKTVEHVSIFDNKIPSVDCSHMELVEGESFDRESGEVTEKNYSKFLSVDGKVYFTGSGVVADFARAILGGRAGKGKFDPPLHIRFSFVANRHGGKTLVASCSMEDLARSLTGVSNGKEENRSARKSAK